MKLYQINTLSSFNQRFCRLTPHTSADTNQACVEAVSNDLSCDPLKPWLWDLVGSWRTLNTSWVTCQLAPSLLMLYDSKLISEPVGGKVHQKVKDGWMENISQRTDAWVIRRSDKPKGLISNIPHFKVIIKWRCSEVNTEQQLAL